MLVPCAFHVVCGHLWHLADTSSTFAHQAVPCPVAKTKKKSLQTLQLSSKVGVGQKHLFVIVTQLG